MAQKEEGRRPCIEISLEAVDSSIRASGGREIPFMRAVLKIQNVCGEAVEKISCHAALGQEGGTVQDVSAVFPPVPSLSPGKEISWDVYDLLLPAHPGTASKVHMFGYRAAMNWRFDLSASAEYRLPGSPETEHAPAGRWSFHWSVPETSTGAVVLTIDEVKG